MGMPLAAFVGGTILKAPEVVDGWAKMYQGIRDHVNNQNDMAAGMALVQKIQKDPNAPIDANDLMQFTNPKALEETYNRASKMKTDLQKTQAVQPLDRFAADYRAAVGTGDFTDPESLAELKKTGVRVPSANEMLNPNISSGIDAIGKASQNEADLGDIYGSIQKGANPPASALSRFLVQGGEKSTNQVKTLAELAKQNDEIMRMRGQQGWINAGGNSPDVVTEPRLRTVMSSAPYGTTVEGLSKLADITGVIPKWKTVETGTGKGEQRQQVKFDERTGETGGAVGQPWLPSAPKITNNLSYQGDKKGIETLVGSMPKYMEEANSAVESNDRITKMIGLLDKGAGGTRGYATATVAPLLEMVGVKSQGLTDAQLYQRLASTLSGSLRMQVVGPGPVSNYEQELLKKVSGGGAIGEDAAKELLTFYKQTNDRKIGVYNNTVDSIGAVAPETSKVYKKIGTGKGQKTVVKKFTSKSTGKTKLVYSDGTEEIR